MSSCEILILKHSPHVKHINKNNSNNNDDDDDDDDGDDDDNKAAVSFLK